MAEMNPDPHVKAAVDARIAGRGQQKDSPGALAEASERVSDHLQRCGLEGGALSKTPEAAPAGAMFNPTAPAGVMPDEPRQPARSPVSS